MTFFTKILEYFTTTFLLVVDIDIYQNQYCQASPLRVKPMCPESF